MPKLVCLLTGEEMEIEACRPRKKKKTGNRKLRLDNLNVDSLVGSKDRPRRIFRIEQTFISR